MFAVIPNVLVVHPTLKVSSVAELIALAKSKPGEIMYGSSGVGTSPHLSGELFNYMAGVTLQHVPYGGSSQAAADLLAGRISVMFSPASSVAGYVQFGQLKALAVTTKQRMTIDPSLPTISEAGLPGFDTSVWMEIMAPAGTPKPIIDRLAEAIAQAGKSDDVIKPLSAQGFEVATQDSREFASYIETETHKWRDVVLRAGLKK